MKKQITLFYLTVGSIIFAVGIYFFRTPNSFIVGGASGLSIILAKIFSSLTMGQFATVINLICTIIGILVLGKTFSWKTIYCSLIYPIIIMCLEKLVVISSPLTDEPLLELIISVILCGIGVGLVIYAGGSTGGIEIFALIAKEKTHFTVGSALMVFNLIIALFSSTLFGVKACMFSVLGVFSHSLIVDKVIQILNSEELLMIVTEQGAEVCGYIKNVLAGSATVMNATGTFGDTEKIFIIVVLKPQHASLLKKNVKKIDRNAFVIGMTTFDIIGGWSVGKNKVI